MLFLIRVADLSSLESFIVEYMLQTNNATNPIIHIVLPIETHI